MRNVRLSLVAVASACLLVGACAGGSSGTGTAGNSGPGTAGNGAAGNGTAGATGAAGNGAAGTSGAAGNGAAGTSGAAGSSAPGAAGNGVAGNAAGSGGATGSAGSGGTQGTAGSTGGATAGTSGSAGSGGATGTAGASGGRGGSGGSSAGTGGRGGSGGSGGSSGATGTAGAGGTVAPFFTDNFESGTNGMQPSGWTNFIAYTANGTNPNGTTLAVVDTTRAHSGTKSVHVHGGSSPAQLTKALPNGTNRLYVRAWIYQTRLLGSMNGSENHETLIGIRGNPSNVDNEVRFGEVKGSIGTNETPSDDFAPKLAQPNPATVAANKWVCFEVAFLGDQTQNALYAWADGTLIHSITSTPSQWEHMSLSANWMSGKFMLVILGWQSFSGIDTDLWIDDVALSTSMIGCN